MQYYPSLSESKEILKTGEYQSFPISCSIDAEKSSSDIFRILKNVSHNVFILESAEAQESWGRYTFLGFDPKLEITCADHTVKIKSGTSFVFENKNPHEYIRKIIEENKTPHVSGLPTFTGGLVGYFSYDFIKYSEPKLSLDATDEEGFNDVDLMLFDKVIVIDRLENKILFIVNIKVGDHENDFETNYNRGKLDLEQLASLIQNGAMKTPSKGKLLEPLKALFDKDAFCEMVEKAKCHIFEGDIFQVVLSNRWSAKYEGSLFETYTKLRDTNPSPYMFYFASDDVEIAGASPETLVKVENNKVFTFPLAGTRPRGKTQEEDIALEKDLLADEKERSEHNMLVDLGRNDIGKISTFGSVEVETYMSVLRFSHVMHIGSTVHGNMQSDKDYMDAIDAVLPAGTLSGAPKIRACEIINHLENNKRGIYGGAIGYIDFSGNMDTCIAIRLAFKKNGKVFVRSGAGIVADSVPESEYMECINKAKAVVNALEV